MTKPEPPKGPTHPHLQATLLMLGVIIFLIVAAVLDMR
jgi:hypothetical protein